MTTRTSKQTAWNELADQHHLLGHALEEMCWTITQRQASRPRVIELLAELRTLVQVHFADEEDGGFFDKIIADSPRIEPRAKEVLREHPALTKQLVRISELARLNAEHETWWSDLITAFEEFSQAFHNHECKENSLLQETYNRDIGTED